MMRLWIIPLGLIALLAAVIAWSGGKTVPRADFTFINRGDVGTLDPNRMSWLQDIRLAYALWEGLYTLDPATLQPIPGCADKIDISPDHKTYTFHLRPNARWSDGSAVTAGDFVFAWRRMLREPGDYTYLFFYIVGAKQYSDQYQEDPKQADFGMVAIHADDPRTLRVTLAHPVAFFPDLCAFPPFFPLNEASMRPFERRDSAGRVSYERGFTREPNLVGNGPYHLLFWDFKRRLRLERSETYWNAAQVYSRTIDVLSVDDPMASFQTYESGGADWVADITGEIAAELRAKGRTDLHIFPGFGTYFYTINCKPKLPDGQKNPFADARVRRAFSMAVDKTPIVKTITRMGEQTASNYIPTGIFADYPSPKGLSFDVAQARQLLAEAGYPDGKGFPHLLLMYNNEAHHGDVAQNVQHQWAKNLNVSVGLEGLEIKVFRERLHNKDYAIARASWIGDYNDPSTFTDKYLSYSENNDSAWANTDYDRLCKAAAVEVDAAKRLKMLADAESILLQEAPIIPIYYYVNAYLFRDNVHGLPLNPRNMVMLQSIRVERKN
ncbi:MAG: peptide ABC transporter substrate-binding protein [Phycisphaerales bacterium]|jgi:oligopeptide transport system substrate-binding protein|nr:peptide ABC transporter substrate-binding protein [Phycisphaerales bacterium]